MTEFNAWDITSSDLTSSLTVETLTEGLAALREQVLREGNAKTADKIEQLKERLKQQEGAFVAFVGLFSAGKSSLLNELCGVELETGANPTTAMVAQLSLRDSDGEVTLLDTPGVDSTDPAHQKATEEALHLADVVVLVMDYQHVEAEENLELAEQFAHGNKRLWIVVNQVDKHFELELSFAQFQRRIETTFADWDISYEALWFTANRPAPHNQMTELKTALRKLADKSHPEILDRLLHRTEEVVEEHVDWLLEDKEASLAEEIQSELGFDVRDRNADEVLAELRSTIHELQDRDALWEEERKNHADAIRLKVFRTIDLAQISPYETTEKGRRYVESLRPGFRVGWLSMKSAVERERQQRLHDFVEDLSTKAEQFLLWPVQRELRELLQENGWGFAEISNAVNDMHLPVDDSLCLETVNEGALLSETYPHQYVADVVGKVKRQCTAQVGKIIDSVLSLVLATKDTEDLSRVTKLSHEAGLIEQWQALTEKKELRCQQYRKLIVHQTVS